MNKILMGLGSLSTWHFQGVNVESGTGHAILIDSVPTVLATILTLTNLIQNDGPLSNNCIELVELSLFLYHS